MYLTPACPGSSPFASRRSTAAASVRHAAGAPLARLSLLLLLAGAAGQAGAVTSLLPPEGPLLPPKTAMAAAPVDAAPAAPRGKRQPSRRGGATTAKAGNGAASATSAMSATSDSAARPALLPAMPAAPAAAPGSWDIVVADRTLNAAMARWAAVAGWQLLWELPVDYAVQAQTSIPGKFEDAVTLVVNSMEGAEIPMKAVFYSGNKVLRIMAKGAQ